MSDDIVGRDASQKGVSRRAMLQGAAWSVPVISVALATPAAAASGGLTIFFAITEVELHHSDTFTGLLYIHNSGPTAIQNQSAYLTLTGTDDDVIDVEVPEDDLSVSSNGEPVTTQNSQFQLTSDNSSGQVLIAGGLDIPVGSTIILGFYLRRRAHNAVQRIFVLVGYIRIGNGGLEATTSPEESITVTVPVD